MKDLIAKLDLVRATLGTLDIRSTRHNLDSILGSIQVIDGVIDELKRMSAKNDSMEDLE